MKKNILINSLLLFFSLSSLVFGYIRLFLGVDFLDEAWYVSTIHNFSLGGLPFLNEYSLQQFPFLLIMPIYKFFVLTLSVPSVIFVRHVYFLLVFITVFVFYKNIKYFLPRCWSLALSSLLFMDVFAIPSISYNTVGRLTFAIGVMLFLRLYLDNRHLKLIGFLSGFFLSICVFSYASLFLPITIFFIISNRFISRSNLDKTSFFTTLGSFLFSSLIIFFIFLFPARNYLSIDLKMMSLIGVHDLDILDKVARILNIFKIFIIPFLLFLFLKLNTSRIKNKNIFLFILLIFISFLFIFFTKSNSYGIRYSYFVSLFSFFGISFYILFRKSFSIKETKLFVFSILPIIFSGLTTALTSANGYTNICVGISPCVVLSLVLINKKFKKDIYSLVVFVMTWFFYCFFLFTTIYAEKDILSLSSKVKSGPYAFIYTTPEKVKFLDNFSFSVKNVSRDSNKTMLCYYNFPAGYLFSKNKMNFYSTWIMNWWMTEDSFKKILNYSIQDLKLNSSPDILVKYKHMDVNYQGVVNRSGKIVDLLSNIIGMDKYILSTKTDEYEIYLKKE